MLLPGESLESITVWADSAKGGVGYPKPTPEMEAYTAVNARHNEYHYANVPFQQTHYHDGAVGTSDVDVVQTLRQAIAVLQGKTDPALNPHKFSQRQALLLIAHMTGDIHQPLHVGAAYVSRDVRFVQPEKQADIDGATIFNTLGGNNLLLDDERINTISAGLIPGQAKPLGENAKKSLTRPLHTYWDSTVVDYAMRRISTRTPEQFAQKIVDSDPFVEHNSGDPRDWPYQWADDALAMSKLAYAGVTPGKLVPQLNRKGETYYTFTVDTAPDYPVPSSALAKTQLIKGGYHLAALLKATWP